MRPSTLLSSVLLLFCFLNVCVANGDQAKALEIQNEMRRELGSSKPKHPPKKPASSSSSTSTGTYNPTTSAPATAKQVSATSKSGATIKVSVSAAGVALVAAAMYKSRRTAAPAPHPLAGSLAKRVENFEKFVELRGKNKANSDSSMGDDYSAMPDTAAMV